MRSPGSSSSKRPSINSATSLASTPSVATRVWMVRSHRSKTMRRPGPDLMLSTMESPRRKADFSVSAVADVGGAEALDSLIVETLQKLDQRPDFVGGRENDLQRDLVHSPSLHPRCGILRLVPVGHFHFSFESDPA